VISPSHKIARFVHSNAALVHNLLRIAKLAILDFNCLQNALLVHRIVRNAQIQLLAAAALKEHS